MESKNLIDTFADFARSRNIDRTTVIRILEEVFRAMIVRKFNTDSNFDVIINLDQGDLQIWRFREIVDDNSEHIEDYDKISLSEAKSIESDFKVGEEVSEEISIDSFGRRAITVAKNTLIEQVKDLASNTLHAKYKALIGEMITSKVSQVLHQELILLDDENNELFLPKSQQIAKDNFKKGDYVHAIISRIELQKKTGRIRRTHATIGRPSFRGSCCTRGCFKTSPKPPNQNIEGPLVRGSVSEDHLLGGRVLRGVL